MDQKNEPFRAMPCRCIPICPFGAWNGLGLPTWAWAFELNEFKEEVFEQNKRQDRFSRETREILLEDQLWNAAAKLSELERERDGIKQEGKKVPRSLSERCM